ATGAASACCGSARAGRTASAREPQSRRARREAATPAQILSLAALAVRRPTTAVRMATMHDRARAYARVSARSMRAPIVSRTSRWGASSSEGRGQLLAQLARARSASTSGSLVPATSVEHRALGLARDAGGDAAEL